ncbi:MAG3240 family lipoprotein [Mycoplasmopsis iners]|uniref:MAG3240 family lipoprotein n=1 Tax=Mycoplasmopsis iners TaxID=76630 RepID=UPI00068EABDE|nr:hypothetical protein [Mycoplasmopsis iners]
MNKKIIKWSFLGSSLLPIIALPISCQDKQNNIKLINYLNNLNIPSNLTKEQLIYFVNYQLDQDNFSEDLIDLNIKNNKLDLLFGNGIVIEKDYETDLLVKKDSVIIENDSYKILDEANLTNIDVLTAFAPKNYVNKNDYQNQIWSEHNQFGYLSNQVVLPNLQLLIYKALSNNPLFIKNKNAVDNLRLTAFAKSLEQQKYFLDSLNFYLKKYQFTSEKGELGKVQMSNIVLNSGYLSAKFSFWNQKNTEEIAQPITLYLDGFFNNETVYKKYPDKLTNQILDLNDNSIHLNEQYNNPLIKFKNNILNLIDFDATMHSGILYKQYNINSFKYLIDNWKEIFLIDNLNDQKLYEIVNFEFTDLLNNSYSIGLLNVKVGETIYPWYSIDFTEHKHLFNGFYIKNELGLLNKKTSENYFSYSTLTKQNDQLVYPQGIDANAFFEANLEDIVNFGIMQNVNNLAMWNNFSMFEVSPEYVISNKAEFEKKLSLIISQLVLLYYIKNSDNTLIKEVKITIDPNNDFYNANYDLGSIPIKIDFIDHKNNQMLNLNNQNLTFELKGFKGTNFAQIDSKKAELDKLTNKQYLEEPISGQTPPYLVRKNRQN